MEYKTIICTDQPTLHKRVNEHIQEGWTPLGGLSITEDQDFMRCGQAMIREPNKLKYQTESKPLDLSTAALPGSIWLSAAPTPEAASPQ